MAQQDPGPPPVTSAGTAPAVPSRPGRGRADLGRGIALTAGTLAVLVALVALGAWQWDRSRPFADITSAPPVPAADVVPLSGRVLTRDQGRPVVLTGTWRSDRQILLGDRDAPDGSGSPGRWVVTAVQLPATGAGPGPLIPVVRGWIPSGPDDPAQDVPAPADGSPARVPGWVQASEPLDNPVRLVQPDGVVPLLAAADLVNRWPEAVVDAFVIADPSGLHPGADPGEVLTGTVQGLPGPVQTVRQSRDWRNVAYSVQWFLFAGVVVVLWWRTLRDLGREREAGDERIGT